MILNNKKILAVTDGSAGMISQVRGLAQRMSNNIEDYKTQILFPWSKLQPGFLPIFKWIFKEKITLKNKPDIVISCGRKSVYLSIYLKKIYKNDIVTIHIQNPKIRSENFDYVVAPNHDNYKGINVINSIGAIHHFTKENLTFENGLNFKFRNNIVSVIIGGKNNHYKFSMRIIEQLISEIKKLKNKFRDYNFLIIGSRRTDKETIKLLENELKGVAHVWNKKTKNPYKFAIKNSSHFILTSDSTSMISECAFSGKPIYIYYLPFKRASKRLLKFHEEFNKMNITRKFDGELEKWNYETLDEAKRISGILLTRILNN